MRTDLIALVLTSVCLLTVGAVSSRAAAAVQDDVRLAEAGRLACSFVFYTVTVWVDGLPEVRSGDDLLEFEIDQIDLEAHTARIVTATATAPVSAFLSDTGLTVLEQTPIGNFMVTTVFAAGAVDGALPAVHSRHFGDVVAPPSPSQYFGSCQVSS